LKEILLIIANKAKADIYLTKQYSSEILKLETINNPGGGMHKSEFSVDRPGRIMKSNSFGGRNLVKENSGLGMPFKRFSGQIIRRIKSHMKEYKSIKVVLIGESGFLGYLKKQFLSQKIPLFLCLPKELYRSNEKELLVNVKKELLFL
jgi:hypothetical protein